MPKYLAKQREQRGSCEKAVGVWQNRYLSPAIFIIIYLLHYRKVFRTNPKFRLQSRGEKREKRKKHVSVDRQAENIQHPHTQHGSVFYGKRKSFMTSKWSNLNVEFNYAASARHFSFKCVVRIGSFLANSDSERKVTRNLTETERNLSFVFQEYKVFLVFSFFVLVWTLLIGIFGSIFGLLLTHRMDGI